LVEPQPALRPSVPLWRIREKVSSGLLALILAALIASLFVSYNFYVYQAEIKGNSLLSAEEIYQLSQLDGQSIFFINPEEVAARLVIRPEIVTATVTCRLPAQVTITIIERQPRVVWISRGQRFWIDEQGTILEARGELPEALQVEQTQGDPPAIGNRLDPTALAAVRAFQETFPQVRAVRYDLDKGLHFVDEHGFLIYLGDGENMERKAALMEALIEDLIRSGREAQAIDVRYPDNACVIP